MLDLVCSYHICPYLECFFFILKKLKGRDVYTTNNTPPLTTYGIDFVQLRNHDELTIILHDVNYVSNLMENLIYMGTLE